MKARMPKEIAETIQAAYLEMKSAGKGSLDVAVRSSATTEDLPEASFAGQHESFMNVKGKEEVVQHVQKCFASRFTDRAIKYREDKK